MTTIEEETHTFFVQETKRCLAEMRATTGDEFHAAHNAFRVAMRRRSEAFGPALEKKSASKSIITWPLVAAGIGSGLFFVGVITAINSFSP